MSLIDSSTGALLDPENVLGRYIKDDKKDDTFLIWLYFPADFLTFNEVINFLEKYDIPYEFIIKKFIHNLASHNTTFDDIVKKLAEYNLIKMDDSDNNKNKKIVEILKQMHDFCSESVLKDADIKSLMKLKDKILIKRTDSKTHSGYPQNDPIKGRPWIDWRECYHKNCHLKFTYPDELIDHLKSFNAYTRSFHALHEETVSIQDLTPGKVYKFNITRCPSYACSKSKIDMTPREVCDHLDMLGIKNFFTGRFNTVGNKDEDKDEQETVKKDINAVRIYSVSECIVCYDEKAHILTLPCNHIVTCINCIKRINKCPVCLIDIKRLFPM